MRNKKFCFFLLWQCIDCAKKKKKSASSDQVLTVVFFFLLIFLNGGLIIQQDGCERTGRGGAGGGQRSFAGRQHHRQSDRLSGLCRLPQRSHLLARLLARSALRHVRGFIRPPH